MNSHVDVASHNDTRQVGSANTFFSAPHYTHHNSRYYGQESMSIANSLSFNVTSNIQHAYPYSSVTSSQYVVPQDKPMNVKIGYDDDNDLTNFSKFFVMITLQPVCLNSQSSHTISIPTSISSISTDSVKGPIEEDILLVNNEIISDCIGERIVSYKGANNNILSNLKLTSMLSLDFTSTWVALLILYSVYT